MIKLEAGFYFPFQNHRHSHSRCQRNCFGGLRWKKVKLKLELQSQSKLSYPIVMSQIKTKPDFYSSRISTDIPLYESPGASFDQYMENKCRVFEAIFPDRQRSQQLNEEEWRVQMLPINFLFLTVWPTVDMRLRCRSGGKDYPPEVPRAVTKVMELDITRWELQGLDNFVEPSQFILGVKGVLYPDRRGKRSRIKGQLEMSMSFVLPPVLAMIPQGVRTSVAESVLTSLVENMQHKVNGCLLSDYSKFKRERRGILAQALEFYTNF